jgi:hypothetical protein
MLKSLQPRFVTVQKHATFQWWRPIAFLCCFFFAQLEICFALSQKKHHHSFHDHVEVTRSPKPPFSSGPDPGSEPVHGPSNSVAGPEGPEVPFEPWVLQWAGTAVSRYCGEPVLQWAGTAVSRHCSERVLQWATRTHQLNPWAPSRHACMLLFFLSYWCIQTSLSQFALILLWHSRGTNNRSLPWRTFLGAWGAA